MEINGHQTSNLGVRGSNPFRRARSNSKINQLRNKRDKAGKTPGCVRTVSALPSRGRWCVRWRLGWLDSPGSEAAKQRQICRRFVTYFAYGIRRTSYFANMQIAAIDYWALASALSGTLMIAIMIWIVVLDRRGKQ